MGSEHTSSTSALRILLVEDSEHDVTAFHRALDKGRLAAEITHFVRAEDALPTLEEFPLPYDLVVADYKLPGMTGLELCKQIITWEICLPCVMVTGAGTEDIAVEALKAGVNDYLVKDLHQAYLEILPLFLPEVVKKHQDHLSAQILRREREVIAAISEMFLAPEELETLCRKLPDALTAGFAFSVSAILLLAENRNDMIIKGISGIEDATLLGRQIPLAETSCGQTIVQGKPVLRLDIATSPELHCFLKDSGINTCLSVPIKGKGHRIMGSLVLADHKQRPDADTHISALQVISHHLGQEIERKQVEDELHLHSKVISNMVEGVFLIRFDDGIIVYTNPKFEKMFGYNPGEMIGKHVSIVNAPTEKNPEETVVEITEIIQRTGEWHGEVKNIKKDGTPFWCYANVSTFNHPIFGQVFVAVHSDINDRKQAETLLLKSKKEWEQTFDAMQDIVTIQDKDMHIVRANKAAHQFFHIEPEEVEGQNCYKLFRGIAEPCPGCPLSKTLQDIAHHSAIMKHENLEKTFHVSSSVITDDNGDIEYLVHIARDITEQTKLEEDLFQACKMEAIGTLAGGIAHDFNNILTAIIGYAEFIQEAVPEESRIGKDIAEVLASGKRAVDLVKQILTFSRKSASEKRPLHPHLVIKEALKMLRSTLPATIAIEERIDPDCGMILANPTNIQQIIVNLCTNAMHAMTENKGTLTVGLHRKELSASEIPRKPFLSPGDFVVCSVSDTGCGMDDLTMGHIFEPYFTTKEVGKGSGLGLSLVHGIVQDCKGFIKVTSRIRKGTTFTVYIPAIRASTVTTAIPDQKNETTPAGSERILIVDDEPLLVKINEKRLQNAGYQVTAVTNSRKALEIFLNQPDMFDLLITDQTMPGLTGAELAKAMLDIKPSMPVIMCTGHSDSVPEERALAMGIKKYVFKPLHGDELLDAVREVLDNKK